MWSLVLRAGKADSAAAEDALRQLCAAYQAPILAWLRRRGWEKPDAEDLAQNFIVFLLERNRLGNVERGATRFRSFLLECLTRFSRNEWRKATAAKRGGGAQPVLLEDVEPGVEADLAKVLDREFALAAHRRAMTTLEQKFAADGRVERWRLLRRFIFGADAGSSYEEVGATLNLKANAVKKAVFDLRDDYYDAFRAEITQTAASREDMDEEMRYLIGLLADTEVLDELAG
jgi:DNA-directed RNA polymerase specialized sigma24 family protein